MHGRVVLLSSPLAAGVSWPTPHAAQLHTATPAGLLPELQHCLQHTQHHMDHVGSKLPLMRCGGGGGGGGGCGPYSCGTLVLF
jgi:hypothetical protein